MSVIEDKLERLRKMIWEEFSDVEVSFNGENLKIDLTEPLGYALAFSAGILDGVLIRATTKEDMKSVGKHANYIIGEVITEGAKAMTPMARAHNGVISGYI